MRKIIGLMENWKFYKGSEQYVVNLPHTWNSVDGQDGGDDYFRGKCKYEVIFNKPEFNQETECVYLEFQGVNSEATVSVNNEEMTQHFGGYSTFRIEITNQLQDVNRLQIDVSNEKNNHTYPQKADFTFYGGIYRDVNIMVVSKSHFDLDYFGGDGIKIISKIENEHAKVLIETFSSCVEDVDFKLSIIDQEGNIVASESRKAYEFIINYPNLWEGLTNPYLYKAVAEISKNGVLLDRVEKNFGIRTYYVDSSKGFFLNGKSYPLRGVSRHQDYKGLGNAIPHNQHDEDMSLIKEIGANTIRLAHYQHDQYFYDLCDKIGMIVWAEIPYISEHMTNGTENTVQQMKELIVQNHHHASIITWGLSNEITISTKDRKGMLKNHHILNDLCHKMDEQRYTSLACYAMCGPFNSVAHISDLVGWNLYLGWYVPGLKLNDLWMKFFHLIYPNRPLGYSEYGAEGMPNLHSSKPRRGDHTEEYQAKYHEYLLQCFDRNPYLWSTYVWNMFDFAADARNQGGEAGMNHKGLITFDRKIKKDSFYLYKAWWSKEAFLHICGSRYVERNEKVTIIKVYSNLNEISLFHNGRLIEKKYGDKIFEFKLPLVEENIVSVESGSYSDEIVIRHSVKKNQNYQLKKNNEKSKNWV